MRNMLLIIGVSLLAVYIYRKIAKKRQYTIKNDKIIIETVEPKTVDENNKPS